MKTRWLLILVAVAAVGAVLFIWSQDTARSRTQRDATAEIPDTPGGAGSEPDAGKEAEAAPVLRFVVRDEQGAPIAGASIGMFDPNKSTFVEGERVTSDAQGRCSLTVGASPWWVVAAHHPEFLLQPVWVPKDAPEKSEPFEIKLKRGCPLTVVVLAPDKSPVPDALVTVTARHEHGAKGIWFWTNVSTYGKVSTDAEGRAQIGGMPENDLAVLVDHVQYALNTSSVEIRGIAPQEHLVILDGGAVIEGRVLDVAGEGVGGAVVKLQGIARPTATSAPDGSFRLDGVGAATAVRVVAEAKGYGPGFFGERLGWGRPVPVTLGAGETLPGVEVVLHKPTYIVGRVVDQKDEPIKGVRVTSWIRSGYVLDQNAESDAEGRFRVGPFSLPEPGQAWTWFNADGHTIKQLETEAVQPDTEHDLGTIKATSKATVRGVVIDVDGERASAGTVRVHPGWQTAQVQEDGTFEIKNIAPGDVHVRAESWKPTVRKSRPVAVAGLAASEVRAGIEIQLRETESIRGRVITPDGKPRMNALLALQPLDADAGGGGNVRASSDQEGYFAFEDLPEGKYRVGLTGVGRTWWVSGQKVEFLEEPAPVNADAGDDDLEFTFPLKGGIVFGKVVSRRSGKTIDEFGATFIRYKFFIPNDSDHSSFSGGEFRRELDRPGTWQVDISSEGYAAHRTKKFKIAAGDVKDLGTIRLGDGGTIVGHVKDSQGQPVPYTRINILNAKFQTNEREPFSDAEGRFELKRISPGLYNVFAVSPRHPLGIVRSINVEEGKTVSVPIDFVQAAPLTVTVTDRGGNPIEGAKLDFTFPAIAPLTSKLFRNKIPPGYGSHVSDAGGRILQHSLPPGEVTLTIEAAGFKPKTSKIRLQAGQANRLEMRLARE